MLIHFHSPRYNGNSDARNCAINYELRLSSISDFLSMQIKPRLTFVLYISSVKLFSALVIIGIQLLWFTWANWV